MITQIEMVQRATLWRDASYRLGGWAGDFAMVGELQDLGRVEVHILRIEELLPPIFARQQSQPEGSPFLPEDMLLSEAVALSRLWLFGLFETLRTHRSAVGKERARPLDGVRRKVALVRAPLAKHKVAGGSEDHRPATVTQPLTGRVGWRVFDPSVKNLRDIYRADLADEFLAVTREIVPAGLAEAQARAVQQA